MNLQVRLRFKILLGAAFLLPTALVFRGCRPTTVPAPSGVSAKTVPPLPTNDAAKVYVAPHNLMVQTPQGVTSKYVPETASVDITKTGEVLVHVKEFGFERAPFLGFQGSDAFRIAFGVDLFYFNKLDLGIGAGDQIGAHTPIIFAKATWVVWQQLEVGLTYDNLQHPGLIVAVKF